MRRLIAGLLAGCLLAAALCGEDSPEELLDRIDQAVEGQWYARAISLIEQGERRYPEDIRFPLAEGGLYQTRELYNLALDAFRKAEGLEPANRVIREELAAVLGFLDRNEEALGYLESLVAEERVLRLADDLGWMYFKTHQPEKGISLLEAVLAEEFDRSAALTLGTLYSELNDRENCRKHYLEAIEDALEKGDRYFASVGYYNLSLAEQAFYDYESAIDYARLSLEQMERAGGYLALGDQYLTKGDYSRALEEILRAEALDDTPLSTMNLASFYRESGRLKEALALADSLSRSKDDSWMYYFGIDSRRFRADLNELFRDIHRGLFHRESLSGASGMRARAARLGRMGKSFFLALYYDAQFRLPAFRTGRDQRRRSSPLRGALTLAAAAEGVPSLAGKYLEEARALEAEFPASTPWYDLELGRETGDLVLLGRALEAFRPDWEARLVEEASRTILLRDRGLRSSSRGIEAAAEIYRQNPGGLRQYGLRLPLHPILTGPASERLSRKLARQLSRQGFLATPAYEGGEIILRVHLLPEGALTYTAVRPGGAVLSSGRVEGSSSPSRAFFALSRRLAAELFP